MSHATIFRNIVKAAETHRSYEVKKPINTVQRNRVHLTPMPEQRENQPVPAEDKITAPVQADQPKQAAPTTPFLTNRPKRLLKPSLTVRENLGLFWHFSDGLDSLPCLCCRSFNSPSRCFITKKGRCSVSSHEVLAYEEYVAYVK